MFGFILNEYSVHVNGTVCIVIVMGLGLDVA